MYRNDFDALQARADAAQRDLTELRASSSQDKQKLSELERELTKTTKELKAARRKLGLEPRSPNIAVGAIVLLLLLVGGGAFVSFSTRTSQVEAMRAELAMNEAMLQLQTAKHEATMKEDPCTPNAFGLESAAAVPFVTIDKPEGCFPRMLPLPPSPAKALPNVGGAAPNEWITQSDDSLVVIHNEAEFQEHYYCPDKDNKDENRPSGLDFKRFQVVVYYSPVTTPEASFAVNTNNKTIVGVQPIFFECDARSDTELLANPSSVKMFRAAELLLPAGGQTVEIKECQMKKAECSK